MYTPNIQTLGLYRPLQNRGCLSKWVQPENVGLLPKLQTIIFRHVVPDELPMVEQLDDAALFKFFRGLQAEMLDMCDSTGRLPLVLELEVPEGIAVVEKTCDLLAQDPLRNIFAGNPLRSSNTFSSGFFARNTVI